MGADGGKQQPVARGQEARRVGDRRHFERRLGAVQKRVEHLRVHAALRRLLGRQAVMIPDRVRGRGGVLRQVLGALAGGHDAEAAGAGPVDHLADQRRLVAIGHRIDQPGAVELLDQIGAGQNVGLDIHHDHVATVLGRQQGVADAGRRMAGRIDHHVEAVGADQRLAILGDAGPARRQRIHEARRGRRLGVPAGVGQRRLGAVGGEIGDAVEMHAGNMPDLRQEHRSELARADQADANGLACRLACEKLCVEVHGEGSPWK